MDIIHHRDFLPYLETYYWVHFFPILAASYYKLQMKGSLLCALGWVGLCLNPGFKTGVQIQVGHKCV